MTKPSEHLMWLNLQVRFPSEPVQHLAVTATVMVIAAFLTPALRTLSFGTGVMYIYVTNFWKVHSLHMVAEVGLYAIGAIFFLRCVLFLLE